MMVNHSSDGGSLILRWLRASWLAWVLLLALALLMPTVVTPRVGAFMNFWYTVPADAPDAAKAHELRILREQQVNQRLWMIGAAPVALLALIQLVLVAFTRRDELADENSALLPPVVKATPDHEGMINFDPEVKNAMATERTVARSAEHTIVRNAGGESSVATSSLEGDGAMYIGGKRYRIDRLLASGGMGSVHKGYDNTLQREVAIKELDVSLAQDQEQSDRFRQEALALAGLAHPHIVPVYDLVEDSNRFWIVMELLSGGDLEDKIEKNPPSIKVASNIIRAVAEGLAFAHNKGIVHRDIKPMNILFNADGIPKLVDFGIAKLVQSRQSVVNTREGLSLGSPTYMSPEQVKGKKDIDKRTDIYALGVTFYKMLVGNPPFTGDAEEVMRQHIFESPQPPIELNAAVAIELNDLVLKMLEKNPADRFQSLEEVIASLDDIKKT